MTITNNIVSFSVSPAARKISALFADIAGRADRGQVDFFKCNGIYWITMDYGDTYTGFNAGLEVVAQAVITGGFFSEDIYKINGVEYTGEYYSFKEVVAAHPSVNGYDV